MTEQEAISLTLSPYLALINQTPVLLSILYDVNLLPECVHTVADAERTVAVCLAYRAGQDWSPPRGLL